MQNLNVVGQTVFEIYMLLVKNKMVGGKRFSEHTTN